MDIQISYDYREQDLAALPLEELARFALEREDCPPEAEVSITFVDDDEMTELNGLYRGKEGPTDVLSFECDGLDDDDVFPADPAGGGVYALGDIVIAPDVAERQTAEFGTTFEAEVSLLLTHGLLHLCGYDHMDEAEAEEMEAREADILAAWAQARNAADIAAVAASRR